jgi:aspartate/methionine/tyrosine aminotransferase
MVVINNPNNPTGATIPRDIMARIIDIARRRDIIVFSDEVYWPLFHGLEPDQIPPSAISMGYDKCVVTSSMSKAWALAGIRLGWIASRNGDIMDKITTARDYTTISVSQLDDQVARYALSPEVRPHLIDRNLALARTGRTLLDDFVKAHAEHVSWVRPTAATTGFVRFLKDGEAVDDEEFCKDVIAKTRVMFLPGGRCFGHGNDFKGYCRIGYVCEPAVLREALEILGAYVEEYLA